MTTQARGLDGFAYLAPGAYACPRAAEAMRNFTTAEIITSSEDAAHCDLMRKGYTPKPSWY